MRFAEREAVAGPALAAAQGLLPERARGLEIGLHLSQDRDGGFDIVLHAVGPDLHVLNKAIGPHRTLFSGRTFTVEGRPANLPAVDLDHPPFDVCGVIIDESFDWAAGLWQRHGRADFAVPVDVFAEDGWTHVLRGPQRLHGGAP